MELDPGRAQDGPFKWKAPHSLTNAKTGEERRFRAFLIGPITVPTLFAWGDDDDTVGRMGAEATAEFIAAPYRFEVLAGGSHYTPNQMPERVSALLLEHLAAHPGPTNT